MPIHVSKEPMEAFGAGNFLVRKDLASDETFFHATTDLSTKTRKMKNSASYQSRSPTRQQTCKTRFLISLMRKSIVFLMKPTFDIIYSVRTSSRTKICKIRKNF
jgi:hypothetical protein